MVYLKVRTLKILVIQSRGIHLAANYHIVLNYPLNSLGDAAKTTGKLCITFAADEVYKNFIDRGKKVWHFKSNKLINNIGMVTGHLLKLCES